MRLLSVFLAGALFSLGLAISGMTRPDKVIGFLDVFGAWDPSLAFVMAGAVLVNLIAFRRTVRPTAKPVFAPRFGVPTRRDIDLRLLAGSALFGTGWGIAGFCPGPALASLPTLGQEAITFMAAMVAGMYSFKLAQQRLNRPRRVTPTPPASGAETTAKRAGI